MTIIKSFFKTNELSFARVFFRAIPLRKILTFVFVFSAGLTVSPLQAQINYSNNAIYCSGTYTYSTNATAYAPTGTGACGFPAGSDPSLTAAINSSSPNDYQAGLVCGACAAVLDTATSKSITLMIDNSCGTCTFPEQLDLTQATWQALTGNTSYGVLPIQWGFVPCPASLMAGDASSQITY